MGMFDYIKCEAELPLTDVPAPVGLFQTKDTEDQYLTIYTITADGFLEWQPYHIEEVPKAERPYPDDDGFKGMIGSQRRVEHAVQRDPFHGDLDFYTGNNPDVGWWEYRATFDHGKLLGISVLSYRAPEGRDTNAEIAARRRNSDGTLHPTDQIVSDLNASGVVATIIE